MRTNFFTLEPPWHGLRILFGWLPLFVRAERSPYGDLALGPSKAIKANNPRTTPIYGIEVMLQK
jgi:hypothetical protein